MTRNALISPWYRFQVSNESLNLITPSQITPPSPHPSFQWNYFLEVQEMSMSPPPPLPSPPLPSHLLLVKHYQVSINLLSPMLSQSIPSKKGWFRKSSIPFWPNLCSILQHSLWDKQNTGEFKFNANPFLLLAIDITFNLNDWKFSDKPLH